MTTVGVVGAGTIGRGVAQAFAEARFDVVLVDVSAGQLASARAEIERDLRMGGLFRRPAPDPAALDRITFGSELELLAGADVVVENVTEDWRVKEPVYRRLDRICPPHAVFAVNTSAIPIARVAAATTRPGQVLGLHFMNPVPLMPMVEVIRGADTSAETLALADRLLAALRKEGVVVGDVPGFVTNRVLMLTVNEAIACVQDGVADAAEVDRIAKGCFGHRMGPLETADLIGLDTILNSLTVLHDSYGERFAPAPLLRDLVAAGRLGRKTGHGLFPYPTDAPSQ